MIKKVANGDNDLATKGESALAMVVDECTRLMSNRNALADCIQNWIVACATQLCETRVCSNLFF